MYLFFYNSGWAGSLKFYAYIKNYEFLKRNHNIIHPNISRSSSSKIRSNFVIGSSVSFCAYVSSFYSGRFCTTSISEQFINSGFSYYSSMKELCCRSSGYSSYYEVCPVCFAYLRFSSPLALYSFSLSNDYFSFKLGFYYLVGELYTSLFM